MHLYQNVSTFSTGSYNNFMMFQDVQQFVERRTEKRSSAIRKPADLIGDVEILQSNDSNTNTVGVRDLFNFQEILISISLMA